MTAVPDDHPQPASPSVGYPMHAGIAIRGCRGAASRSDRVPQQPCAAIARCRNCRVCDNRSRSNRTPEQPIPQPGPHQPGAATTRARATAWLRPDGWGEGGGAGGYNGLGWVGGLGAYRGRGLVWDLGLVGPLTLRPVKTPKGRTPLRGWTKPTPCGYSVCNPATIPPKPTPERDTEGTATTQAVTPPVTRPRRAW